MHDLRISDSCQVNNLKDIYLTYFNRSYGYFVEVGAFDGQSWSNTDGLADLGWHGIYIEPVDEYMDLCKSRHSKNKNIIFEHCAIGLENSDTVINVVGGLSTLCSDTHEAHKNIFPPQHFGSERTQNVKIYRLDSLLIKNKVPLDFDLLVVDVEGYELEVFKSFDLTVYKPKMIIVELSDVHPSYNNYPELQTRHMIVRNQVLGFGYKEIYKDSINTIFYYE